MPEIRSVTVRLNAEVAKYIADIRGAGRETERAFAGQHGRLVEAERDLSKVDTSMGRLDRSTRLTSGSVRNLSADVDRLNGVARTAAPELERLRTTEERLGNTSTRTGAQIDQLSGRIKLVLEALALVGPGLVPIGALGVPALAGVASAGSLALLAVGGLVGSLQGVKDTLTAVDAAQLDPTVENLEKADQALARLSPHARELVAALDDIEPVLIDLRDAGAEGWAPGLIGALTELKTLAPELETLMLRVGRAGGEAIRAGVESLAGERWQEFREFLLDEAPDTVSRLSRIIGDLGHGAASMWIALDPGNDRFLDWVESVADGFDRWADSPQGREDVEAFLDYAAEHGPQVQEFFVSLVDTAAQLVQAAAPLGGPVLEGLTLALDVIGQIADSDMGTPILGALAALSAYNRVLAITDRLQRSAFGPTAAAPGAPAAVGADRRGPVGVIGTQLMSMRASIPTARELGTVLYRAGQGAEYASAKTLAARDSVRALGRSAAPTAAGLAGVGLVASGAADKIGLTSTATLALTGAMVGGPLGAVAGGLVGAVMDVAAANNAWEDSQAAVERGLGRSRDSLAQWVAEVESLRAQVADQQQFEDSGFLSHLTSPSRTLSQSISGYRSLFGGSTESDQMSEFAGKTEAARDRTLRALGEVAFALGDRGVFKDAMGADVLTPSLERLGSVIDVIEPHLGALNLSFDDLKDMSLPDLMDFAGEIERLSAPSNTNAVGALAGAIEGIDNAAIPAAERARDLADALDALTAPGMDLVAATDAWAEGLDHLSENLAKNNRDLTGQSDAARQNRAVIADQVNLLKNRLVAEAQAGAGSEKLSRMLDRQRNALIDTGTAAGLNEKQLRNLLRTYGLTPDAIRTVLQQEGVTEAEDKVRNLIDAFKALPRDVRTKLREEGADLTRAKVNELLRTMDLTKAERRALITLRDDASGPARALQRLLNELDGKVATTVVRTRNETVYVRGSGGYDVPVNRGAAADGITVPKTGKPYADRHLFELADGEEVVSNRFGQADRHRPLLKAINENRLADGGTAGRLNVPTDFMRRLYPAAGFTGDGFASAAGAFVDASAAHLERYLDRLETGLQHVGKRELAFRDRELERLSRGIDIRAERRERIAEREVNADRRRLDAVIAQRDALEDQVRAVFEQPLFAAPAKDPTTEAASGTEYRQFFSIGAPENGRFDSLEQAMEWARVEAEVNAHLNQPTGPVQPETPEQSGHERILGRNQRLREALKLYKKLQRKGFDGPAFRALVGEGDIETLREYAILPKSELAAIERDYETGQRLEDRVARYVGQVEFGGREDAARADWMASVTELREIKAENRRLANVVERLDKRFDGAEDRLSRKTGDATGKAVARELKPGPARAGASR